jgi:SAM-dependent methyltransferase
LRLTDQEHWDGFHSRNLQKRGGDQTTAGKRSGPDPKPSRLRQLADIYSFYLLFAKILPRYLPQAPGSQVVELGSAPGYYVVRFKDTLGCDPYGIEFSGAGVKINQEVFAAWGIPPDHVIAGDFLDPALQERWAERFDVVTSFSLIEHFAQPEPVIQSHLNLLKPGGLVVALIPNLKGINRLLYRIFNPANLAVHNLDIMAKDRFGSLFPPGQVAPLYLNYLGTFSFHPLHTARESRLWPLFRVLKKSQTGIDFLYRIVLRGKGLESRSFSPWLLFIGRKR